MVFKLDSQEKLRYKTTGWVACLRNDAVYIVTKVGYKTALIQKYFTADKPEREYLAEIC